MKKMLGVHGRSSTAPCFGAMAVKDADARVCSGRGGELRRRPAQRWLALIATCAALMLGGCASLPSDVLRPVSSAIPTSADTTLGELAAATRQNPAQSGFRLLYTGTQALHARIELAQRAQRSLDVQYYHIKSDATGRLLLRTLRDAANRGVRVRLLLDDLYTSGEDELLLGLAAYPNVELRLFNPFPAGRSSLMNRFAASLTDLPRVHRRMHNKMFVVDGAMAVVGGRNVADAYYLRDDQNNFFDFDVFTLGAVVPQLQRLFDAYWNNRHVYPVQSIIRSDAPAEQLRRRFDAITGGPDTPDAPMPQPTDRLGNRPLAVDLNEGRLALHWGSADAFADSPEKIADDPTLLGPPQPPGPYGPIATMRLLVVTEMAKAQREFQVTSPYHIPGEAGLQRIREIRARGVRISILTNSLASTDEPLVHTGYRRYRTEMLKAGVELYEISPVRGKRLVRELLKGQPAFRLHNKSVVFDREWTFIGSLNLDPRSQQHNTEMGLIIRSPELARDVILIIDQLQREAAYQVRLDDDGGLEWVATDANGVERVREEPESGFWSRLLLEILAPLLPEGLL